MSRSKQMPLQVWILTLSAFAIGTAEFVIAGILTDVADSLSVTAGQAGNLITAYAMAIVIGGPILSLWLARFEKRNVLLGLMGLFIAGNLLAAFSSNYAMLMVSRIVSGLTQGPFYGIGAVVATRLVDDTLAGRAVGQMFAGLTLANVLGVPAGAFIGHQFGWNTTFIIVAMLGVLATLAMWLSIPRQPQPETQADIRSQLTLFRDKNLLASLTITVLGWVGFMTFYGYVAPVAEQVAGYERSSLTWLLVLIGFGLVLGNSLGGKSADSNLSQALKGWPAAMILSLLVLGVVSPIHWAFPIAAFVFGVVSFANVPPMQMRVMKYGKAAPELAATANISAFNLANALGGIIGGVVVDSTLGAAFIPYAAALIPTLGLMFIFMQERKSGRSVTQTASATH